MVVAYGNGLLLLEIIQAIAPDASSSS